jgi:thiosulfate/3-mercaptopyruvate sulfurtransferase
LNADGTIKGDDELREIFRAVDKRNGVIAMCGSGVTACVLALAMDRIGVRGVKIYDGSWTDWANRKSAPIRKY